MNEALSLLPATTEDAEAIRALTREAYAKWVPVIGREPLPMTADYGEAVKHHRIDLLYLDGKLAALIEMIPQVDHLLIENVAVSPALQGRGFGRTLLTHAEQVATSLGLSVIKLYTNKRFTKIEPRMPPCFNRGMKGLPLARLFWRAWRAILVTGTIALDAPARGTYTCPEPNR